VLERIEELVVELRRLLSASYGDEGTSTREGPVPHLEVRNPRQNDP
jgi:hypothetical protein